MKRALQRGKWRDLGKYWGPRCCDLSYNSLSPICRTRLGMVEVKGHHVGSFGSMGAKQLTSLAQITKSVSADPN